MSPPANLDLAWNVRSGSHKDIAGRAAKGLLAAEVVSVQPGFSEDVWTTDKGLSGLFGSRAGCGK